MSMTHSEWRQYVIGERAELLGLAPEELDWSPTQEDIDASIARLHAMFTAQLAHERVAEVSGQVEAMHYQLDQVADMVNRILQISHQPRRRRC